MSFGMGSERTEGGVQPKLRISVTVDATSLRAGIDLIAKFAEKHKEKPEEHLKALAKIGRPEEEPVLRFEAVKTS